jgi:hypothetical protein
MADFGAYTILLDHAAGDILGLGQIVMGSGGNISEYKFFSGATSQQGGNAVKQFCFFHLLLIHAALCSYMQSTWPEKVSGPPVPILSPTHKV